MSTTRPRRKPLHTYKSPSPGEASSTIIRVAKKQKPSTVVSAAAVSVTAVVVRPESGPRRKFPIPMARSKAKLPLYLSMVTVAPLDPALFGHTLAMVGRGGSDGGHEAAISATDAGSGSGSGSERSRRPGGGNATANTNGKTKVVAARDDDDASNAPVKKPARRGGPKRKRTDEDDAYPAKRSSRSRAAATPSSEEDLVVEYTDIGR
ncbi:hypothetical protein MKEN_00345700 [Mycena kentingensis (nom. inval.)]|nr:hypothetical protein MKEN_00345700 [Mycena kentingensis (nom. inval.)]